MDEIVTMIMNNGITVVILAYFIFRDYKFMQKLDSTLDVLKAFITKDEKEEN